MNRFRSYCHNDIPEPSGNKKTISKYQANRLHKNNITEGPTELAEDVTSGFGLLEYRFKLIQ